MSKFKQLRALSVQQPMPSKGMSKFEQLRALQQQGDSWPALIGKSALKGVTAIGDIPRLVTELADFAGSGDTEEDIPEVRLSDYVPSTGDIRSSINKRTGIDLEPHPTTAGQRIANRALEFGGASLIPGANLGKINIWDKFKNAGKLAGMGTTIGGTSGVLQESGVNPLVADISSTLLVPNAGAIGNFAKNTAQRKGLELLGVGKNKLNVDALMAAQDLGIQLPTAAATRSAGVDLADQAISKIPFLGDTLKKKYLTNEEQTLQALEDIYNQVGPKKTPEVRKQISELYEQARNTLPENAAVIPSNTLESLGGIKKNIVTPIPNSGESKLLNTVGELSDYYAPHGVQGIEAPVKSLIGAKKSLNDDIDWNNHHGVRDLLKNVKHSISKDVEQYGAKNPKWFESFTKADKQFAKVERRKELEELLGKAINPATDSFSYNSLSKIIHADKTDNTIKRLVDPETYKKIQKLGEVSKAMAQKMARTPNPSGTAPTAAALGLVTGFMTAPLTTVTTVLGAKVATKLLTDQKFLDYAIKVAQQPKSMLDVMALTGRIKDLTGYTPAILSKELERHKIQEKKKIR